MILTAKKQQQQQNLLFWGKEMHLIWVYGVGVRVCKHNCTETCFKYYTELIVIRKPDHVINNRPNICSGSVMYSFSYVPHYCQGPVMDWRLVWDFLQGNCQMVSPLNTILHRSGSLLHLLDFSVLIMCHWGAKWRAARLLQMSHFLRIFPLACFLPVVAMQWLWATGMLFSTLYIVKNVVNF